MSDPKMALTAPIVREGRKITADYLCEGISPLYVPGGWENRCKRYFCIPDYLGFVSIEGNFTGGDVKVYVGDDEDYDVVEPTTNDVVRSKVPPAKLTKADWPIVEEEDFPCNHYASVVLGPDGELDPHSFYSHKMGRLYLVKPELAEAGAKAGRLDMVPVTDGVVRIINLSDTPMDISINGYTMDPCEDNNPYASLPLPRLVRVEDNNHDHYRLINLPPERPHTVYMVNFMIAALAHATGRHDLLPIG